MADTPKNARAVSTDALETLGTIHTRIEKRDAIHLAVEPVRAESVLWPGNDIDVFDGVAVRVEQGAGMGIVDPFLTEQVLPGQRFWFVMKPRAVHSLRHVWTHPSFPDPEEQAPVHDPDQLSPRQEAERRLAEMAAALGYTYPRLMELAIQWLETKEYIYDNTERYKGIFEPDAFWRDYEIVTGKELPDEKKDYFFTCSC